MTREEAIKILKSKMDGHTDTSYEWAETVRMAIKALEQEPCEDAISREAVHDLIATWLSDYLLDDTREVLEVIDEKVEDLPSVTPKGVTITDFADRCRECGKIKHCNDAISRKDVMAIIEWAYDECKIDGYTDYCEMRDMVKGLQAVTPQTSEDYISRTALLAKIDEERKHLLDLKMDGAEHIIVHHARRIIEDMPTVTPKTEWIPVTERLPEKSGKYLVTVKNGNVYAGTYDAFSGKFQCAATAWQPLPEPYEESED